MYKILINADFHDQKQALILQVKERSDSWMNVILPLYFLIGLFLAHEYDTWNVAFISGGACLLAYYSIKLALPQSNLYQYVLSAVLGIFMAQFIYQMHGLFEMHFFAFIGSALLITYQKWRLQIPILIVVGLHHGLFSYLQDEGYKQIYFTQLNNFEAETFVIHVLLTFFIDAVCGLWAYHLDKLGEYQILQNLELSKLQKQAALSEERKRNQEELEKINQKLVTSNTQLQRSQEEAQQARLEAEKANQAKSVFLATMSHEIRTPLNGVVGMSYLLAQIPLSDQQKIYVNTISSCSESLLSVINDILDFSKIEAGSMELELKDLNIKACLEEVIDMFKARAAQKNLELTYCIDQAVPASIIADKTRLQQVLINLIGNAIKFTHKGKVHVDAQIEAIEAQHIKLKFEVADTGIGIPPEKTEYLFKAFSQIDSSHNRKYGGTGLGLAISEKLVKLMKGECYVKSEPGRGSVFGFTIIGDIALNTLKEEICAIEEHEGKSVLVVDDNETNCFILKELLESWKLKPFLTNSVAGALHFLNAGNSPHLVLLDAQMPGTDGIELTGIIKKKFPHIPLLLLSSVGDDFTPKYMKIFAGILQKPVRHSLLEEYITRALCGKQPVHRPKPVKQMLSPEFGRRYPMQILVTEDNKVNQMLIVQVLKKLGYSPKTVDDGIEAVRLLETETFDLVLMDMQMPEMDGLEATKRIRKMHISQPVIIALTANAVRGDREDCINAGMDDYMTKPLNVELLKEKLERWHMEKMFPKTARRPGE